MRTYSEWLGVARGSIRTSEDKHREIAAICWHDEQSGGFAATWHASSIVHGHPFNCVQCAKQRAAS